MNTAPLWKAFLETRFPGYLLPESAKRILSWEQAARFLAALSGRSDQLHIVRASATLAANAEALVHFVDKELTTLLRVLPSRTEVRTKTWTDAFCGRLDVPRTSILHAQGATSSFVTQSRRRQFDLPENVVVRAVAERLLASLVLLRRAKVLTDRGWSAALFGLEAPLRRMVLSAVLREVPAGKVTGHEEQAAKTARHPAYRSALHWFHVLRDGLDSNDPTKIAEIVAAGALAPLEDHTQFELAVVLRLAETLYEDLEATQPGRWTIQRTLILPRRDDILCFARDDGAKLRFFYNVAELPSGVCDQGLRHYLGGGPMRPDITVVTETCVGQRARATVFEVKCSHAPSYLVDGYQQATVYRWEYGHALTGWPKAVLVVPEKVRGEVRDHDDVVAVGWATWLDPLLVRGLLRELQ
jgi:hypothetical protein